MSLFDKINRNPKLQVQRCWCHKWLMQKNKCEISNKCWRDLQKFIRDRWHCEYTNAQHFNHVGLRSVKTVNNITGFPLIQLHKWNSVTFCRLSANLPRVPQTHNYIFGQLSSITCSYSVTAFDCVLLLIYTALIEPSANKRYVREFLVGSPHHLISIATFV